ncbi:hypothetical protein [uncultured Methanobrevibacter sp.]|uniref:hypothetical protein n=1 Tax=uncultured Methanobrevibacter sp. TaxID=253161 RepID=UPI00260444C4|nr:hypothetical protein [uncultured Methanobrevibacter sp.]
MVVCPNCAKKLRDNFSYCRVCGCEIAGENPAGHPTEILNVFHDGDEFIYLFCERGNQVVLRSSSIEDLKSQAKLKRYPWILRDRDKISTDFQSAGEIQSPN